MLSVPTMADATRFSISARARSFHFALRGLATLLASQHNAWIHAAATLAVAGLGLALGISRLEWCAIALAVALVWTAEALNTALEILCDVVSPDRDPRVARVKDVAAGGVLASAIGAAVVGLLVFVPHLSG